SFLMADDVLDFAFSSRSLPSEINATTTAAASKYTCACSPRACQNSGKNVLNVLNTNAIPVDKATRVSMLALPWRACFQALTKKFRPNQKTTGAVSIIEISLA